MPQWAALRAQCQAQQHWAACRGSLVHRALPDHPGGDLHGPHDLPGHQDGLTEACRQAASPTEQELMRAVSRLLAALLQEALRVPQPAASLALEQVPDGQQEASRAGPVSGQRAVWPEASDAHRAHDAHRVHGVRRPGLRDAPCRPAPHGARDVQQAESGRPAARRAVQAERPEVPEGLDAAAGQPRAPDAVERRQEAQAGSGAAQPAAPHAGPGRLPEGLPDVALPAARRAALGQRRGVGSGAQQVALRAAGHQPAVPDAPPGADPLAAPSVRLLPQGAPLARAGSAHRHSMHEMR